VESIVRFAASDNVELLVFPEYSIPPETLPLCRALSEELGIAIIAGSHVITISSATQEVYRALELTFEGGGEPPEERVRQAASVVFVPGQKPIAFVKYIHSKWETHLVKGAPAFHTFQMSTKAGRIEVQVLICIEALSGKPQKEKHNIPRLIAITAFSPRVDSFHDEGARGLLQGKCTLFANVAEFGGSRAFARADNVSLWFAEKNGSKPLPLKSEALLVVEADLERQFEIRQVVTERTAVTDLRVYPLLYPSETSEAQQYSEVIDLCNAMNPTLPAMSAHVSPFTTLTANVFPKLLQDKLAHFIGHVAPAGTISTRDAVKWITPVTIRDIQSTDRLRWELCSQAMESVSALLTSQKYVHKTEDIANVYMHLLSSRNKLASSIKLRGEDPTVAEQQKPAARTASSESPFIDRDLAFDKIRQFFGQQQSSIFILGGMRGIGKRALVEEAFRQAIPPRKRIWLEMTDGISYERLLAQLGFACNLQLPANLDLSKPTTQTDVKKRLLAYLGQGPGAVVVLDEFQFLLGPTGETQDGAISDLLLGLAEAGQSGKAKCFFISHVFPRLGPSFESCFVSYTLHGLEAPDTRRLLLQWLQFGRDELSGPLPVVSDRLISVLGGHPLATKVAARLCAENPTSDIAEDLSIFRELRDTMVSFILEKLTLSPAERELLSFASIFRLPAPREVFFNWRKDDAGYLLSSLAGRYLIESSHRGYQLHPLVRSFFGNNLPAEQLKSWHKVAARFYLQEFNRLKQTSNQIVPEYLGEAVHHYLAAGDRQRVKDFAFYAQELRPVALDHYRNGDQKVAMKDYQVLLDLDSNDVDAHFHLSLIFARLDRWADAEFHFGKALQLKPKAPWILQAYGAAKLRARKTAEGEALLLEAEKLNPNHSPTLAELGRLRETQRDFAQAEAYYRRAIQADPNNSYALYHLARLLFHEGSIHEAYETARAALTSNPTNPANKAFMQELKAKIAEDAKAAGRPIRTLVQIRCAEKTPQPSAHERIASIGGINSDGKRWKITTRDAISQIENGKYSFFLKKPTGPVDVVVARAATGEKYLKSATDKEQPEDLLSLPTCP